MQKVDKLHFLIHPGFDSDPDVGTPNLDEQEWMKEKGELETKFDPLISSYLERAKNLSRNDIIAAFVHTTKGELKEDFRASKSYAAMLHTMRSALGRRLVVLTNDENIFFEMEEEASGHAMRLIREICARRGYEFTEETSTVAYGEELDCCVVNGAIALNKAGGFKTNTLIETALTDFSVKSEKERKLMMDSIQERTDTDNVIFDFPESGADQ